MARELYIGMDVIEVSSESGQDPLMSVSISWRCHLFNAVICECCERHVSFSKAFLTTGLGNMEMERLLSHCRLFPISKIRVSRASTSFPGSLLEKERPWLHMLMSSWRGFPSPQSRLPIFPHRDNEIILRYVAPGTRDNFFERLLQRTEGRHNLVSGSYRPSLMRH